MATAEKARVRNQIVEYGAAVLLGGVGGAALAFMSVGVLMVAASILGAMFLLFRADQPRLRLLAAYLAAAGIGFYSVVVGLWA